MPRIDMMSVEREKLLNEACICLIDEKTKSVPKPTEAIILALTIVKNLKSKIVDSNCKLSIRDIYIDNDENGDILPF